MDERRLEFPPVGETALPPEFTPLPDEFGQGGGTAPAAKTGRTLWKKVLYALAGLSALTAAAFSGTGAVPETLDLETPPAQFLWSLGENVYSAIYGNIGTQACAAMTMTTPIQCLMVGALSGLSKAAAILIGKSLGTQEYDRAYRDAQRLMRCGLAASLVLSALLLAFGRLYTTIYRVEPEVHATAYLLLVVFAVIFTRIRSVGTTISRG